MIKKFGLKDENIVVMMYDDIAYHKENPRPGVIINHPSGVDVYKGILKDYTGNDVTAKNFLAIILGQKSAVTGGSGKVLESGPDDHIFIYYSGHGLAGVLEMPMGPELEADDLIRALKEKYASKAYKSMVFYVEACYSGSMFKQLPRDIKVFATTAANENELSYATYCPWVDDIPPEYKTCLGNLYSITWIEDSEGHNLRNRTLKQQYHLVKKMISPGRPLNKKRRPLFGGQYGSHVQQFGDTSLSSDSLFLYIGTNPANDDMRFAGVKTLLEPSQEPSAVVSQDDADLLFFYQMMLAAPEGSELQLEAQRELFQLMEYRVQMDRYMKVIGYFLFGLEKGSEIVEVIRRDGEPFVGDWGCFKSLRRAFEAKCGKLSKHIHLLAIANFCNAGIGEERMLKAAAAACDSGQALEYTPPLLLKS